MSGHRNRQACLSCTRRKVKCSKEVPCTNCVRRGEQDSCGIGTSLPETPDLSRGSEDITVASTPSDRSNKELELLRRRVRDLETQLQYASSAPSAPSISGHELRTSFHDGVVAGERSGEGMTPSHTAVSPLFGNPEVGPQDGSDIVIRDAASILEFLAWGRRKLPDYEDLMSPESIVPSNAGFGDIRDAAAAGPSFIDDTHESHHLNLIQLLLPSRQKVWHLVDYHEKSLLWYHNSFYAPTFRSRVHEFYERYGGSIQATGINLQWVALLFSVLTGSITCAPAATAYSWGFKDESERQVLSKRWFQAVMSCLNSAGYTANLCIFSAQAISTLTMSAHLLGFSNMQSIHLAAAVRVAQSLGLHRLTQDAHGTTVEKETGRRLWSQLCSQDWFGIPFSESYLVHPAHSCSEMPSNCHDDDMIPLPENIPTISSYCSFLYNVAAIMPRLQDGLTSCNTSFTRYEHVLGADKMLRSLATAERPGFLSNVPLEPSWPIWIPWARRALAISSAHKIIMIHRSFLSESFTNPAFSFTRRTCLAASKTIIKEYKQVIKEDGPILWIHQAFSVAASIILILDVLHRKPSEKEYMEHRQLAEDTVAILSHYRQSLIATRGLKLLSALLHEIDRTNDRLNIRKRPCPTNSAEQLVSRKRVRTFNVPAFVRWFCMGQDSRQDLEQADESATQSEWLSTDNNLTMDELSSGHPALINAAADELVYSSAVLEGTSTFENLLNLAHYDFPTF